jgi:L-ascorbate metabolism protein UlaG (beta-lactamase superfamily)
MRLEKRFGSIPDLPFERRGQSEGEGAKQLLSGKGPLGCFLRRTLVEALPAVLLVGMSAASEMRAAPVPPQVFETSAGPVEIPPIYHASTMIKAGDDTIYIDPAHPANIAGLQPAGLILITDIHPDHMDGADISALSDDHTEVVAPSAVQATVKTARVLSNGECLQWHNWRITAVPMYNNHHLMPNGIPFHPKGRGNGYVLSYGGKNFYFAGDTEGTPEMGALRDIDVAFVPMNLPYTMSPEEAADAVKAFMPKVVIPYHYRGQDPQRFADALSGTGIEVRLLDWYSNIAPGAHLPQPQATKSP